MSLTESLSECRLLCMTFSEVISYWLIIVPAESIEKEVYLRIWLYHCSIMPTHRFKYFLCAVCAYRSYLGRYLKRGAAFPTLNKSYNASRTELAPMQCIAVIQRSVGTLNTRPIISVQTSLSLSLNILLIFHFLNLFYSQMCNFIVQK